MDDVAVRQHRLHADDVMDREAVLEAVGATGVFRDVPADRTDQLTRRIGRVVVAGRRDAAGDIEVDDARLDDDTLVLEVDGKNAVEARQDDEHAILTGNAPPDNPVPCPRATKGTPCR